MCLPSASICQNSAQVADLVRIDHRQLILRGDLDQAQLGAKRVFRDELGVEADAVGAGKLLAKAASWAGEVIVSCDTARWAVARRSRYAIVP